MVLPSNKKENKAHLGDKTKVLSKYVYERVGLAGKLNSTNISSRE